MNRVRETGSGIPTLDASNLSYQFERVQIDNPQLSKSLNSNAERIRLATDKKAMPSNLTYIDDFYNKKTGTSGTAFKVNGTKEVIVAYTGTNPNFGDGGWKKVLDKNWWSEFFQKDVMKLDLAGIGFGTG
ncbi:hypothetical protein AB1395_03775 [Streptococcus pluranimalium]|uniref:hypothetical protein n=1 Tax=Streptococcus pluranimalium TaxID=82348 RepID=UPI003465C289